MATIDYLKDDIVINGTATSTVITALREAQLADTRIVDIVGNWFIGATRSPRPAAFRFDTDVEPDDAQCVSAYERAFAHTDWIDGESRVQAGMTPEELGFNARFHAIENEFDAIAGQLDRLSACAQELRGDLAGVVAELEAKITAMQNEIHGLQQERDEDDREGPAILGTIDLDGITKFVTRFGDDFRFVSMDTQPVVTDFIPKGDLMFDPRLVNPGVMRTLVDEVDLAMDEHVIRNLFENGEVTVGDLRRHAGGVTLPSGVMLGSLLANADASTSFADAGEAVEGIVGLVMNELPAETLTEIRSEVLTDAAVHRTGGALLNSGLSAVAGGAAASGVLHDVGINRISDVRGERPSEVRERVVARGGGGGQPLHLVHDAVNNAILAGAIRHFE